MGRRTYGWFVARGWATLIDELRLMTYPVVVGAGERLFGRTSGVKPMRLVDARTVDAGLAFLTYQPVRDLPGCDSRTVPLS